MVERARVVSRAPPGPSASSRTARRGRGASRCSRSRVRPCGPGARAPNAIDSTKMSSALARARARPGASPRPRPSRCRRCSRSGTAWARSAVRVVVWGTIGRRARRRVSATGAHRHARGRSPTCTRTWSCRCGASRWRAPVAWARTASSGVSRSARADEAMPPPAGRSPRRGRRSPSARTPARASRRTGGGCGSRPGRGGACTRWRRRGRPRRWSVRGSRSGRRRRP